MFGQNIKIFKNNIKSGVVVLAVTTPLPTALKVVDSIPTRYNTLRCIKIYILSLNALCVRFAYVF